MARVLLLSYRPPFDWNALLVYLAARATPGVEAVDSGGRYWRSVQLDGHQGYIAISPAAGTLRLELSRPLFPVLTLLIARLRRLFDLDVDLKAVARRLRNHAVLAPLIGRRPGLRVPGAIDGFELALRTVLGQQVSVRGATTLAGRLARQIGEPLADAPILPEARPGPLSRLPVTAERLAGASVGSVAAIGLPRARAACIVALARAAASGELPELTGESAAREPTEFVRRFTDLPGIGPWTAAYVAMRALRWPDAFPEGDLGLRKAMGGLSPARLRDVAEQWRPWRAYAAQHLWASLGDRASGTLPPHQRLPP